MTQNKMVIKLKVTAGPTREEQTALYVNDDAHPFHISSPFFEGRVVVRVRDFKGITPFAKDSTTESLPPIANTPYFDGNKDLYSIQIQGRFKSADGNGLSADDIIFGNDFDKPLRLPPLSGVALSIAKRIDPGLSADITSDKPWAFSPFLVAVNTLNLSKVPCTEKDAPVADGVPKPDEAQPAAPADPTGPDANTQAGDSLPAPESGENTGTTSEAGLPPFTAVGEHLVENTKDFLPKPMTASERRNYLAVKGNRELVVLDKDTVVSADFFNPYLDMNAVALKLPGFSLSIMKYWDGQPLRYICQHRDKSHIFFVVTFSLQDVSAEAKDAC